MSFGLVTSPATDAAVAFLERHCADCTLFAGPEYQSFCRWLQRETWCTPSRSTRISIPALRCGKESSPSRSPGRGRAEPGFPRPAPRGPGRCKLCGLLAIRRSSSARQSKRLIIAVSPVQVRPPLPARRPSGGLAVSPPWRPVVLNQQCCHRGPGINPWPRGVGYIRTSVRQKGTPSWLPPTSGPRSPWPARSASTVTTSPARTGVTTPTGSS